MQKFFEEWSYKTKMGKRFLSCILVFLLCLMTLNIPISADETDYIEEENTVEKEKTQSLYDSRPVKLWQAEDLDRGMVAVSSDNGVLISWRYLGTDAEDYTYQLYKGDTLLAKVTKTTNYSDASGKKGDSYTLKTLDNTGKTIDEASCSVWDKDYISIPVKSYEIGNYIIEDASVGDLDGDGEYEIVIRRTPANYFTDIYFDVNGKLVDDRVASPIIEAYKMDGTYLWTINIGKNEVNEIDINFLVYDFNQDGKAEIVMRSYDGMMDGTNKIIGDAEADWTSSLQKQKDRQYLSKGNEYLSMFDGETGAEISRTELLPKRDPLESWASRFSDIPRLTKRASHFLLTTAFLDGETPSVVMMRGAWDGVKLAAWDYKNDKFEVKWEYDSGSSSKIDNLYGAGYHSLAVADIDFDGMDEILSGAGAIDHDGSFMYATYATAEGAQVKLEHGDAFDVAKMTPDYDGYYVWSCHEIKNLPANIDLHDARSGQVLLGYPKPKDTGRSRAADIDPTNPGWEVWGSTGTPLLSLSGDVLAEPWNEFKYRNLDGSFKKDDTGTADMKSSLPMCFKIHWDGDLLSEFLDGVTISKYNWTDKCVDILKEEKECSSIGGTKAVPCLAADILGDWRDEVIWRSTDDTEIRIYSTTYETQYKIPTPMSDRDYRQAVAWQNNHYNQPTNTSYYMGNETKTVPVPEIKTVSGKTNPAYAKGTDKRWDLEILVEGNEPDYDNIYSLNNIAIQENKLLIDITKNQQNNNIGKLFVVFYDEKGMLANFKTKDITLNKGENAIVDFDLNKDEYSVKCFIWDDDSLMRPLSNVISK